MKEDERRQECHKVSGEIVGVLGVKMHLGSQGSFVPVIKHSSEKVCR